MDGEAIEDMVALVKRATILDACRGGPASRAAIAERADCSRTTAYRATTSLTDRDLLEQVDGGYRLTGFGATVLDRIERFRAELDGARHLRPVLEHMDAPELRENAHLFTDATIMEASLAAPYAVEQHLEGIIADVSERIVGGASSFGSPMTLAQTVDRVEAGVEFAWALPRAVLQRLDRQHGDLHATVRAHDNTTVHVVEDVTVDCSLYDDTLVLTGFDEERGTLAAVATTDDPAAVEWADGVLERYRARGDRII